MKEWELLDTVLTRAGEALKTEANMLAARGSAPESVPTCQVTEETPLFNVTIQIHKKIAVVVPEPVAAAPEEAK